MEKKWQPEQEKEYRDIYGKNADNPDAKKLKSSKSVVEYDHRTALDPATGKPFTPND